MSKRRSRNAVFLSRVLTWFRLLPEPDVPRGPHRLSGRIGGKWACGKAREALTTAAAEIANVNHSEWKSFRASYPEERSKRGPAEYYSALTTIKQAYDRVEWARESAGDLPQHLVDEADELQDQLLPFPTGSMDS